MKVAELIEILQGCDEEAEVRLATQPQWPFEHGIDRVVEVGPESEPIVYIGEGGQIGYLPGAVKDELGW